MDGASGVSVKEYKSCWVRGHRTPSSRSRDSPSSPKVLHIYLDERDNRQGEELGFVANGFTEESVIHDYPARSRKMVLHVRRRRYKDADGHNIIRCNYPLAAEGTRLSVEFGAFLKTILDSFPVTSSSVARFFHIKGSTLERNYKESLSGFNDWDQKEHAADWILLAKNLGEYDSIDETTIGDDVYTIFSNKAGHGGKGTIIAVVKGTKAEVVSRILKMIPLAEREKVKEVTMDFSDSMYAIVRECFPNATIVIDCFHIVQRLCEALDEMRLRFKRLAVTATKKEEAAWKKSEDAKAKKRAYGRTKYAVKKGGKKKPKGKKRGRKRIGKKKYRPTMLSNGDTLVELLTRGRYVLAKSAEKWGKHQRERAHLLFELYPKLREAYSLICTIRAMFRNKKLTREAARGYLHNWYEKVNACTIREIKSARDCIKAKEEEVLNYFNERHSNASAESLNSKIKGFRAQVHGVADIPYFMYRLSTIFG